MEKKLKDLRESLAVDKMLLLVAMLESRDVKIFKNCQSLGGESCIRVQVDDISLSVYKKHGLFGNVYYSIDGMRLAPHVHEKLLQKMRFCCAAQQREKLRLESARIKACRCYVTCLNNS